MSDDTREGRMFVLDTNVLMHDPTAMFRFQEHDVYVPMVVLEELDAAKKGTSDIARNVREVSRILDEVIRDADEAAIGGGIPLPGPDGGGATGRLFLQTRSYADLVAESLPGAKPDNGILNVARAIAQEHPGRDVVIVSRDINLRIKARALGIHAEDYRDDVALDDVSLLYPGVYEVPADHWEATLGAGGSGRGDGSTVHVVAGSDAAEWFPNQCLYPGGAANAGLVVRRVEDGRAVVEPVRDYRAGRDVVWGVNARNIEQNFALNLLMDPDIDLVTLIGTAGTGKTLLALAAGLAQTLDEGRYREIVMTRVTVPVGDDIGFLPGTEEEKMTPWMGALMDNLEVLTEVGDRRRMGTRGHQRPAAEPHQGPIAELHARAHLPQPVRHPRRGAESHPPPDEDTDHPRRTGDQDGVPRQRETDRHALGCRRRRRDLPTSSTGSSSGPTAAT